MFVNEIGRRLARAENEFQESSALAAASTIVVSGVIEMTGRVMIWWARMGCSASSNLGPISIA
jgi:hypothetical protein